MELSFQPLTPGLLDRAAELCDLCVGKNLYPRAALSAAIDNSARHFHLLVTPQGEAAGYIYFTLTDLETMARLSKLPRWQLAAVSPKSDPVVGNLQSIAVAPAWRGQGLSRRLVEFYLDRLADLSAHVAMGVFWKPRGRVPMAPTLLRCGFRSLGEARLVWYDKEELVCPYCTGRCRCDGEVFYKPLETEGP